MCFLCSAATGMFNCKLKYIVKDCDPTTGQPDDDAGYEDEYTVLPIADFENTSCD